MAMLCITFLAAETITYLAILILWLFGWSVLFNLPFFEYIILSLGIFAILGGTYFILEYFRKKGQIECNLADMRAKRRQMKKMKKFLSSKYLTLSLLGMIILAFSITSIEFLCSAWIPALLLKCSN